MKENKNLYWLAGLMSIVALATLVVVYFVLWQTAIAQKKADLVHIAQSQARLIEAIARFDMRHNRVDWETPIGERGPTSLLSERAGADTFSQIVDAHKRYQGFGETGEILIAGIEDAQILFLLRHGSQVFEENKSIPLDSELAEPMRRALSNLSGTMIGLDYEGIEVLAAYEPIDVLNLGIVAKVNFDEVKQPFIKAGLITLAITVVIILIGGVFFRYFANPIAQQIIDNERKFRSLVENISEWIWEIDLDGHLIYSSPQAIKIFGFNPTDKAETSFYSLIQAEDIEMLQASFEACLVQRKSLSELDCIFVTESNQLVHLELNIDPVTNSQGSVNGFRGIGHDVTERVAKEQELKRYRENLEHMVAERTEELEQINTEMRNFAYIISHDLRSPLVSITGFTGELKEDFDLISECAIKKLVSCPQEVKEALDERIPESIYFINSATEKMNHLIHSILTLSRAGRREFHFEPVNLATIVNESLASLAYQIEQFKVTVKIDELPTMVTDKLAMEQIVGNLLGNAVKYLSPDRNGVISICAEITEYKTTIHIKDNGRGIAQADLSRIFDLFKRVGAQDVVGDGMGLTYVQALVRRLGGKINCNSTLNEGSDFYFSILNQDGAQGDKGNE